MSVNASATIPQGDNLSQAQTQTRTQEQSPPTSSTKTDQKQQPHQAHHVIFVVHGMGRQLEVPFGNYEKNVSYFVDNTRTVLQSQFHDLETDVHIIPIEWHAKLHSMVDERMALTSLRTVPKVRLVMNDYMADILYYFNPHFGSQIVQMIVEELNEAYDTFIEKHPDFNGKISVYALSLGGVAMFDILTCQDDDDETEKEDAAITTHTAGAEDQEEVREPPAKKARVRKQDQSKFRAVIPKLKFRPEYLFTVGSPVGAVMVMRNMDWETFHPPDDIIHHNIFHPFDPLGYRLEPLIDPVFAGVPATVVSSYQSQLFPSLSLPSLPSLQLPESISAFWENRVPTLPRPSIPTLSSISLMTQSLKAGRWLPGSGGNKDGDEGEEGSGSSQDSDSDDDQEGVAGTTAVSAAFASAGASSPATSVSNSDIEELASQDVKRLQQQPDSTMAMMDGGDASVSEFMGAATAATYLEQTEDPSNSGSSGVARPADVAAIKVQNDTTTESPQKGGRQLPVRRPSLGPRRISSRVEDDEQQREGATAGAKRTMLDVAEESYLGMEDTGSTPATAQEKALGVGAKSDVIQESIVRSMPEGGSPSGSNTASANNDTKADVEDTTTANRSTKKNVHVEGRATKLPYRIDHVLQETTVDQYTNEYLLGMRSHFKYWGNRDVALHILKTMLGPVDSKVEKEEAAAEAKAKTLAMASSTGRAAGRATAATMRSRSGTAGSASDTEVKKQNRMSFSFSFFSGGQSNSSTDDVSQQQKETRARQETADEDLSMMDEEGGLFGYRYSEQNMSSGTSAATATTTKTLFQSSPWTSSKRRGGDGDVSMEEEDSACTWTTSTTTTTTTTRSSGTKRRISVERKASSTVGTTSSTAFVMAKKKGGDDESVSSESGGEETEGGAVVEEVDVLELERPAKLHHRAARVE
ncbi:hypothetical protein BGZ96_010394 [Linnemannia gamsii]|uniref:DDHD domain-containing protein n=1 Tax=Linnemannia gamsii TaxID=64522 RepID=A0ABQ7JV84_9FUNG|nr:hypothetical protein BGZ96_010394 [Linnemannia gamsii]